MALVEVDNLVKHYQAAAGGLFARKVTVTRAVDGVSFEIARGETLALVGESGCGKSTTGRLLVRLIEPTAGTVRFEGIDVSQLSLPRLREVRRRMQFIFQDPGSAFNPRMS